MRGACLCTAAVPDRGQHVRCLRVHLQCKRHCQSHVWQHEPVNVCTDESCTCAMQCSAMKGSAAYCAPQQQKACNVCTQATAACQSSTHQIHCCSMILRLLYLRLPFVGSAVLLCAAHTRWQCILCTARCCLVDSHLWHAKFSEFSEGVDAFALLDAMLRGFASPVGSAGGRSRFECAAPCRKTTRTPAPTGRARIFASA